MDMLSLWPESDKNHHKGDGADIRAQKREGAGVFRKPGMCVDCGARTNRVSKLRCRRCAGQARVGKPVGVFPARVCAKCAAVYTPTMGWQKQCFACLAIERACVDCGAAKRSRGPRCIACRNKQMIDSEIGQWNRKAPQTVEEIIAQGEAFLIPTTYYAFGYVMGVVFGDGSISTETNTIPHTRSDGTVRTHDSTVYRVRLQTVSGVFAKRFAEQWTILTGKPPTIQTTVRSKWSASSLVKNHRPTRLYMVQPRHTILGRYLKHIKYVEERGHERVLGWPQEVQQAFMHGMIDSEGYVGPRQTYVYNMNWALLETVGAILSRFDAKFTIQTGVPPSAHHLRTITSTGTGYDKFDVPKYVPVDRHWALGPNRDEEWKKYRHTSGRY